MLVSTFELLVKPQFPKNFSPNIPIPPDLQTQIGIITRTVIQGYFLTISNLNAYDVTISLVFTVVSNPPVATSELVKFIDIDGMNLLELPDVEPDLAPNKIRYTRKVPASETGLFLLQPNVLKPGLLEGEDFEVRGYVEVFISSLSTGYNTARLLLTPEHRGTFYENLDKEKNNQLDQIAYSLPTAHGGSLFELSFH